MRRTLLLVVVSSLFTIANPSRAQFCPGVSPWVFDDVAASDPFCGYITWMAQNGITLGCQVIDGNHRLYCPNANVSRAAMAAFMNRLGNVRVEAVGTGPGLTGGPITGIGTINLASTQLLPTTACATNQIPKWNGSAWVCSADANSGGTVTSVGTSTGLTGGPITSTGTLSIATGYQLPQSCTNGQVPKSNGAGGWTCGTDTNSGGTVTSITAGNGLTGGTITTSGTIAVDPASTTLTGNFFKQGGNAFGATAILGTIDNNALDVRVNGARVMRYEPNAVSPNVIGGSASNSVTAGVRGATIAGGGLPAGDTDPDFTGEAPNRVTDAYGTVGGGYGNVAGDNAGVPTDRPFATVAGGFRNTASNLFSTVVGGSNNTASGEWTFVGGGDTNMAADMYSVVAGGASNAAVGAAAIVAGGYGNNALNFYTTVGGGLQNAATASGATVAGGMSNNASGTAVAVGGGQANIASGHYGTVPGGQSNVAQGDYSFAAGRRAKALANGVFILADGTDADVVGDTPNVFAAAFTGGIGMWTSKSFTNGCSLAPGGGSWSCGSSRDSKQDFVPVDGRSVLDRVVALSISEWRYKAEVSGARHVGPMAQDFHAAFGLGDSEKTIGVLDASGVALAAIQGLNAKLEAKVEEQARQIANLEEAHAREIAELKRAVEVLLARTSPEGRVASR